VLARVIAFREGLEALGWTENRNIRIEHRYSGGDLGRIRAYATELVHSAPDVIVGSGTPIIAALKEATSTTASTSCDIQLPAVRYGRGTDLLWTGYHRHSSTLGWVR
jgi:ABC-type uncharacterized transport system substrate-binding protein